MLKLPRNPFIAAALLVAGALLAGCGGTQVIDAPPAEPAVQTEYRIGPGDNLQIFVWNHPELTVTIPVRPDGLISTPLVENMPAGGKTPSQLSRDLEKALGEYVRSPTVNVIVTGCRIAPT
jgi:polysaccharide export outer membrane protein